MRRESLVAGTDAGLSGRRAAVSSARRGGFIYVLSTLPFIATDSLAKSLVADSPIVPVVFGRCVAYLVAVVLLMGGGSVRSLVRTARPWTQVVRGLLMFGSTVTCFWALSLLPLAEVGTLSSTAPLIVVALAGPFLGERVTRASVVGVTIGFAGVLLLVGLDPAMVELAVIVPLANAVIMALLSLLTRELRDEPASVTMFWSGVIPLIAGTLLLAAVPSGRGPSGAEWMGIGAMGLLALAGHWLMVTAYRCARASDLAPIGYLGVLWAFMIGSLVFGEPITAQSALGALAIAAGGIVALRSGNSRGQSADGDAHCRVPAVEVDTALEPADAAD